MLWCCAGITLVRRRVFSPHLSLHYLQLNTGVYETVTPTDRRAKNVKYFYY